MKLPHIFELWDFADPAKSEQTQIARTCSLRARYAEAHAPEKARAYAQRLERLKPSGT